MTIRCFGGCLLESPALADFILDSKVPMNEHDRQRAASQERVHQPLGRARPWH
jgi:hypothetical protein